MRAVSGSAEPTSSGTSLPPRPGFVRRALALFIPAVLNLGAGAFIAPLLNAVLARSPDPAAAIGGYAVAFSLISLVALPQMRVQQLTLVFLDDRGSLGRLRRFVAVFAILVTLVAVAVALTPLGDLILVRVFAVHGALRAQASAALPLLVAYPALAVMRTHLYGATLRIGRGRLIVASTLAGVVAVVAASAGVTQVGALAGAPAAALAVTLAAALEIAILAGFTQGPLDRTLPARSDRSVAAGYGPLIRFFAPLLVAALLPTVTPPILNAALARAPEPAESIAAFAVAGSVNQVVTVALWGVQPTVLALLARREDPHRIRRFANLIGWLVLIPSAGVAFIPPITQAVLGDFIGAADRVAELATLGLWILALLPPILVQEQIYSSTLMNVRRTRPIAAVNVIRLAVMVAWVLIALNLTSLPGVAVGVGGVALTLVIEALATYLFGRGAFRALALAWDG